MTALAQGAAGLAVALGFALLGTGRTSGVAMLCAAQAVVVAFGALAQGEVGVAAVELVEAGVVGWLLAVGLPLPLRAWAAKRTNVGGKGPGCTHPPPTLVRFAAQALKGRGVPTIFAGALLAALAAIIPGTGLPLAVILLGLLLVASRPLPSHRALGIAAVQNGLVLAAITAGLANWRLILVVLPWLPGLAFGALWLGSDRARVARLVAPRPAAWIDAAVCALAMLAACALPWQLGAGGPFWRLDALAVHGILLLAALAAAASWAHRDATPVWGSQVAVLVGTVLALLSNAPLLCWIGMALATVGAVAAALPARAEAWRRLRLGCTGLGLALFGAVSLHAATPPLPATACVMLGYGALAVLAPELTVAAVALILRMRGAPADDLLLALGLAALLVAALGLATGGRRRREPGVATQGSEGRTPGHPTHVGQRHTPARYGPRQRTLGLVELAQGGVAVFAFGLGTQAGSLAGLLQLSFLALTECALLLARQDGMDRLAALAGLAGLPPFGLFPSLTLILVATAERLPWLLLPLGAGLAAVAWAVLLQLPAERRPLASPAWVPLVLLLIAGFAMPDPLLDWFRLAAQ